MSTFSDRIELRAGAVSGHVEDALARLWRPLLAIGLGMALLAVVGFVPAAALHNAAHDGRHAFAFACH